MIKDILNYLKCKFLGYCSIDRVSEKQGKGALKKCFTFVLFIGFMLSLAQNAFYHITQERIIKSLVILSNKVDEYELFIDNLKYLDVATKAPIFKDKALTEYLHNIDTQSYKEGFNHLGNDDSINREAQKALREAFSREKKHIDKMQSAGQN